jgi:ubiquinone/menaquinone biosynthesis C-methylase UbiE
MDYIDKNQSAYDIAASQYKKRRLSNIPCEVDPPSLFKLINSFIPEQGNPKKMLEIGPGVGQLILMFSEGGYETIGIDLSSEMLKIASSTSPNTKFINANVLEYNFPEDNFDVICAAAVIHCFPENDAVYLLQKINKWIKQEKGIFYVHTTAENEPQEGFEEKKDYNESIVRYRKRYTEDEFESLLIKCNFKILNSYIKREDEVNKLWQCYVCGTLMHKKI